MLTRDPSALNASSCGKLIERGKWPWRYLGRVGVKFNTDSSSPADVQHTYCTSAGHTYYTAPAHIYYIKCHWEIFLPILPVVEDVNN